MHQAQGEGNGNMNELPELTAQERNALIVVVCIAVAGIILAFAIGYGGGT